MTVVVTLGEVLLRLKAPGLERLFQTPVLEAIWGGAEANVAQSLAVMGVPSRLVTALPANDLGDAALASLRATGVDLSAVRRLGDRVGLYFVDFGANQRLMRVTYDRAGSGMSIARPTDFDWDAAFAGADWFHVSGVMPAVSAEGAETTLAAAREARKRGITVSVDYNLRRNMWRYGKKPPEVMHDLVALADVGIGNEESCRDCVGIAMPPDAGQDDGHRTRVVAETMLAAFPNLKLQALTMRERRSADHNGWQAALHDRKSLHQSARYEINDIVDRVGAGDAFAAGLIYGLRAYGDPPRALQYATAAGCLKHSIPGDYNRSTVAEIEALVQTMTVRD